LWVAVLRRVRVGTGFGRRGAAATHLRGCTRWPAQAFQRMNDKTDAVEMYSERIVTVQSADKIKTLVREAYKIVRPGGRDLGTVVIPLIRRHGSRTCTRGGIPAQGKDYEVKEKDGAEVAMPRWQGSELITDVRAKVLHIPAADPGNLIVTNTSRKIIRLYCKTFGISRAGYPARESHYTLQLPAGWDTRRLG